MPVFELDFNVYCSCGNHLCNQTETKNDVYRGSPCAIITPCEKCLSKEKDDGYDAGFKDGYKERDQENKD